MVSLVTPSNEGLSINLPVTLYYIARSHNFILYMRFEKGQAGRRGESRAGTKDGNYLPKAP